ncbi:fungal-specific transcription factor domain-containing protein [Coniochaeta sp. 2T2.1]|nr:fungal-specific transcription factor domain-containing protein [Coniochaeta sp. 2T2.1]
MRHRGDKLEVRNRPPKSCDPCRLRKLKCNRGLPCDTCIRRSKLCEYAANADRKPAGSHQKNKETVTDRLNRLENLVLILAREGGQAGGDADADAVSSILSGAQASPSPADHLLATRHGSSTSETAVGAVPSVNSDTTLSQTGRSYVDPSHWSSLLEDIRQIRDELSPPNGQDQSDDSHRTPTSVSEPSFDLVFVPFGALDLRQILANLPPRQLCDRLVSQYFRARHAILPIVHPVKFQREYALFWESPKSTCPLWIGQLFSILSLSASLHELSGPGNNDSEKDMIPSAKLLSKCTERCLVLGKYTTAKEYSLEVLLILMQSCFLRSKDSDLNMWLLMGIIIRLAFRLGYHRDPSKLTTAPKPSPFEGEMRRRVWATIFQIDTLMSFQIGLPSMIPAEYCDADLPRNLENSDFNPETTVLPDARPILDHTPILYTLAKSSIMFVFRSVTSQTRSLSPSSYDQTLSLDAQIRDAYAKVPPAFRYTPISQSVVDSPGVIMDRTTIEILHLKSVIVLHRGYITAHRANPRFDFSRRACLQAAETVLHRQVELHEATRPGCQLNDQRWMVSALTTTDFILAGMVVCLELTVRMQGMGGVGFVKDEEEVARYLGVLRRCQGIWAAAAEFSSEARMASEAMETTLRRNVAWMEEIQEAAPPRGNEPSGAATENENTEGHVNSDAQNELLPMLDDEALFIDWGILDNQFHDTLGEGADLDAWLLDAVQSSGPMDLL